MTFRPARLTVYCGSKHGARPAFAEAARAMGRAMADRGLGLVYGGGRVGLMGVVADAVLEAGGHAIGVIPRALAHQEIAHEGLSECYVVSTMHERKAMMTFLGGGFLALPGGLGTFEELFEVVTGAQLGFHHKPVGLLDVDGYYQPLHALLDHCVAEGFVAPEHRELLCVGDTPDALIDRMAEVAASLPSEQDYLG